MEQLFSRSEIRETPSRLLTFLSAVSYCFNRNLCVYVCVCVCV